MKQETTSRKLLLILMLAFGGALANYFFPLNLTFGITLLPGSILAILAILLTRHPASSFAILISMSPTILLWGHPWALLSYLIEGLVLYRAVRRERSEEMLWLDTLYWPLCGLPLIVAQYTWLLGMPLGGSIAAAVKQGTNAVCNTAIAALMYYGTGILFQAARAKLPSQIMAGWHQDAASGRKRPRTREFLLVFLNLGMILPFLAGILLFVRHEENTILLRAEAEVLVVEEALVASGWDRQTEPQFREGSAIAGFQTALLGPNQQVIWSSNPEALSKLLRQTRLLSEKQEISVRTLPNQNNPMLAWQQATVVGIRPLESGNQLWVFKPFGDKAAVMNGFITTAFSLLLLWLMIAGSVGRLFTGFLIGPLENLRRNAENLQRDPAATIIWPDFNLLEIQDLRDSLVAMTGTLINHGVELREARNTALQQLKKSERYLAFMGHELKAPLSAVYSGLELLQANPSHCSEQDQNLLGTMQGSINSLILLINDLLDQAQTAEETWHLAEAPFSPAQETRQALETYSIQAKRKGLAFELNLSPLLERLVWGDALRFRQLLSNLVSNAIKYTNAGRVQIRLDTQVSDNGMLLLEGSVSDTGQGIDAEIMNHIWEPFASARGKLSDRDSSHGLGMSIVKSIVQAMQGSIEVNSSIASGTTFRFSIPFRPVGDEAAPAPKVDPKLSTPEPRRPTLVLQALVVDDERLTRLTTCQMLRSWGAEADEAAGGEDALARLRTRSYQLVVLDQHMPGLSGTETAKRIREFEANEGRPAAMIILSTADDVQEGQAAISLILPKPLRPATLRQALSVFEAAYESRSST